jgi:aquaporin Z
LQLLFGEASAAGVTAPKVVDGGTATAIEVVLTLLLVSVVLGTADRHRVVGSNAALAVGATIALCGLVALPVEGASMNPARSLGPALVAGELGDLPIYLVGPTIGAVGAVLLTRFLHGATDRDETAEEAARGTA